jgi:hypothetical protein
MFASRRERARLGWGRAAATTLSPLGWSGRAGPICTSLATQTLQERLVRIKSTVFKLYFSGSFLGSFGLGHQELNQTALFYCACINTA